MTFRYSVYGLSLASERPLPELRECAPAANESADLSVHWADGGAPAEQEAGLVVNGPLIVVTVPDIARYELSGDRITVFAGPSARATDLRLFLLGSVMGVVLHHRGVLPLHANAVVRHGNAVAFLGASGAGKSTLAAWLIEHGYDLLSDDVCAVRPHGASFMVAQGIPRLRLCSDALGRQLPGITDLEPVLGRTDKFTLPISDAVAHAPASLQRIYLLDQRSKIAQAERVRGAAAVELLAANTYRGMAVGRLGLVGAHLNMCHRLAAAVPVYRLPRPARIDDLEAANHRLLRHLATLGS